MPDNKVLGYVVRVYFGEYPWYYTEQGLMKMNFCVNFMNARIFASIEEINDDPYTINFLDHDDRHTKWEAVPCGIFE
jgi:hypothetical protein